MQWRINILSSYNMVHVWWNFPLDKDYVVTDMIGYKMIDAIRGV